MNARDEDGPSRADELRLDAERGRVLLEESREIVVVINADDLVVAASRRAREAIEGLSEGVPLPESLSRRAQESPPLAVPLEVSMKYGNTWLEAK